MDTRNFQLFYTLVKERRAELQHDLEVEAMLNQDKDVTTARRHVLLSVSVAAVLLVIIIASSAHLFV
jgi:hypothetical protein